MGGLLKHTFWVAPVAIVVLFLSWYLNREHVADMRTDEAAFDRDFYASKMSMSRNKEDRDLNRGLMLQAQARYSSAAAEQKNQRDRLRSVDTGVHSAVSEIAEQIKENSK